MRVKMVFEAVSRPTKINVAWSRISGSKHAKMFFFVTMIQALLQIAFQLGGYANNRITATAFKSVVLDTRLVPRPFAMVESNGDLTLCAGIPLRFGGSDPCERLSFDSKRSSRRDFAKHDPHASRAFSVQPVFGANGAVSEIDVLNLDHFGTLAKVSSDCVAVFPWLFEVTHDASREDLVFVLYHLWLFGVSVTAILNDSIPHIAAALLSEFFATIWAIYRVARTVKFEKDFDRIAVQGSCGGVDVLPHFFEYRKGTEIPILLISLLAFPILTLLSWRLAKEYHPRMFKRVESRPDMLRQYRVVLSALTSMQVAAFFLIAVAGLFVDELVIGMVRNVAEHRMIYEIIFIFIVALTAPWLILGWYGVRRESRWSSIAFLLLSVVFIAGWGTMFSSRIFRFMFYTWDFYATMSIFTCLLLVGTVCLCIYATLNSGLGLPEYLNSKEDVDPADRVAWTIESGSKSDYGSKAGSIHLEEMQEPLPVYEKEERVWNKPANVAAPAEIETLRPSWFGDVRASARSSITLDTQPGRPSIVDFSPALVAKPITSNRAISQIGITDSTSRAERKSLVPLSPPGLAPPKPAARPPISRRQIAPINKSRWSATTTTTEIPTTELPTTPATASAVGGTSGDAPRSRRAVIAVSTWSESTTTSSALSEASRPPMPALPAGVPRTSATPPRISATGKPSEDSS